MEPPYHNSTFQPRSLPKFLPIEQDIYAPVSSQHSGAPRPQEKTDPLDSVITAVKLLADLGLNPRQIRQLRQIEHLNALYCLADTCEDELDEAWVVLRLRQPQSTSRHNSLRHSYQSSSRYPSGVPSLSSDGSHLRDSTTTDISVPIEEYSCGGPDYFGTVSAPDGWQYCFEDLLYTSTACLDNSISLPVIEEGLDYQEADVQGFDPTGFYPRSQNNEIVPCTVPVQLALPRYQSGLNQSMQIPDDGHAFLREQQQTSNANQKPRFPCSEIGCPKYFLSENEFSKHLSGDHDKDVIFACIHKSCPLHPFEKSRISMWKKHHSTHHRGCAGFDTCKEERRTREKQHWACGLCSDLFLDVKTYARHYKNHFLEGNYQQRDVDYSTILRGLLRQDATSDKWDGRNADIRHPEGAFHLSWEPGSSAPVRETLEYGTFHGASIDDQHVVDQLLDEVIACANQHKKRHASSPPLLENTKTGPDQTFQRRLLSRDEWSQLRSDTVSALAQVDEFEPEGRENTTISASTPTASLRDQYITDRYV